MSSLLRPSLPPSASSLAIIGILSSPVQREQDNTPAPPPTAGKSTAILRTKTPRSQSQPQPTPSRRSYRLAGIPPKTVDLPVPPLPPIREEPTSRVVVRPPTF
ncbi:hypothetical protein BT67DRAFT_45023 [Trichocladium antarcticum]|uniref:Uncharacterized protein n=1 Tax=Trichocladium antarcticum TaxID=1450529 RepID=A0AAN6UBA0_9PEZI|nr:hypothetical protein BT67DRAFT_318525 [Trichocladium antarcticum]KAK4133298.1 hypothetical protein BT67DRAFT_45023 [Trichocladium antarcticum]